MPENTTPLISPLEVLWRALPDTARDIKLNMASLIAFPPEVALSDAQRWGVALAAAMATRCPSLKLAGKAEMQVRLFGRQRSKILRLLMRPVPMGGWAILQAP